jgi:hypothetical protein
MRLSSLFLCFFLVTLAASGQGDLSPTNAPAPTMKTLQQVEPRREISATNTPGNASNVFIISQTGA